MLSTPQYTGPDLDLVLVHHHAGLPASGWKTAGARLGAGRPTTIDQMPIHEAVAH
jgi:hypothetical protein